MYRKEPVGLKLVKKAQPFKCFSSESFPKGFGMIMIIFRFANFGEKMFWDVLVFFFILKIFS